MRQPKRASPPPAAIKPPATNVRPPNPAHPALTQRITLAISEEDRAILQRIAEQNMRSMSMQALLYIRRGMQADDETPVVKPLPK